MWEIPQVFRNVLGADYEASTDQIQFCSIDEKSCEEITEVVHLGTSVVRRAFDEIFRSLSDDKCFDTRIVDVSHSDGYFAVRAKNERTFFSKYVLVATGKCDFSVRSNLISNFGLA